MKLKFLKFQFPHYIPVLYLPYNFSVEKPKGDSNIKIFFVNQLLVKTNQIHGFMMVFPIKYLPSKIEGKFVLCVMLY